MLKKSDDAIGLGDLLKQAGVPDDPQTRDALQKALDLASDLSTIKADRRVYREIEAAAYRMQEAIKQLARHDTDFFGEWSEVISDVPERLQAIRDKARAALSKRGQPGKPDKLAAVHCALKFFLEYSSRKPSTDPTNPFRAFAERFYRALTGHEPDCGLEHYIRKELRRRSKINRS